MYFLHRNKVSVEVQQSENVLSNCDDKNLHEWIFSSVVSHDLNEVIGKTRTRVGISVENVRPIL